MCGGGAPAGVSSFQCHRVGVCYMLYTFNSFSFLSSSPVSATTAWNRILTALRRSAQRDFVLNLKLRRATQFLNRIRRSTQKSRGRCEKRGANGKETIANAAGTERGKQGEERQGEKSSCSEECSATTALGRSLQSSTGQRTAAIEAAQQPHTPCLPDHRSAEGS